jgi:hypothetical protein
VMPANPVTAPVSTAIPWPRGTWHRGVTNWKQRTQRFCLCGSGLVLKTGGAAALWRWSLTTDHRDPC